MNRRLIISCLITALCVGALACDKLAESENASPAAKNCPGATQEQVQREYHPRLLRGRVLAPQAKLADSWLDVVVPSAHAAPLEDEQPVAGATVELYSIDTAGERVGDVLRTTETNEKGEWCVGLPKGVDPGTDLMLRASSEQAELRRLVANDISTDIYTGTEAIIQLLEDREIDFHRIPTHAYINMEAIADTAVDLLEPVELADDDNVASMVTRIRDTLADDERFSEKLEALPRRDN